MATNTKKSTKTIVKFSDDQIKHLEFIQDAITRMADNSFKMKGWMVAIVSALLAIYADNNAENGLYVLLALLPVFIFWGLDAYFLQQERMFRGIYNDVAEISENPEIIKPFAMPLNLYNGEKDKKYTYLNVFFSKTLILLYVPVVGILLVTYFYLTP